MFNFPSAPSDGYVYEYRGEQYRYRADTDYWIRIGDFQTSIVNIPINETAERGTYALGHSEALQAAAEIAREADARIARLENLIKSGD